MSENILIYRTIGEYVRICRLGLKKGQEDIAKAVGVSRATIGAIEHDTQDSSFGVILKIMRYLEKHGAPAVDLSRLTLK